MADAFPPTQPIFQAHLQKERDPEADTVFLFKQLRTKKKSVQERGGDSVWAKTMFSEQVPSWEKTESFEPCAMTPRAQINLYGRRKSDFMNVTFKCNPKTSSALGQ